MKPIATIPLVCLLAGCGVMMFPAVERLAPEKQAVVNGMWDNMLSPSDRIDRELLLDVLIAFQMHESGVDRLHFESEKEFAGGTILMSVDYNRAHPPEDDRFAIEIHNRGGEKIRREVYTGEEVMSHIQQLYKSGHPATQPGDLTKFATSRPMNDDAAHAIWATGRGLQIIAATQPAH